MNVKLTDNKRKIIIAMLNIYFYNNKSFMT